MNDAETERMIFRAIDLSDAADWLPFFKDPASFQYWKEDLQAPEIECEKWYKKQFARHTNSHGGMNALIEKSTGKLIGHAGLLVQTVDDVVELEIAYSLLPAFWGKGFAIEAAFKCKQHAFDKGLASSLISIISITNTPSAKVAIKNGMQIEKQTVYNQNEVNIFRIHRWQFTSNRQQ
jgi:RimJ/RimL family protein N-acetyltransferase